MNTNYPLLSLQLIVLFLPKVPAIATVTSSATTTVKTTVKTTVTAIATALALRQRDVPCSLNH
jgi:hypothetical protein